MGGSKLAGSFKGKGEKRQPTAGESKVLDRQSTESQAQRVSPLCRQETGS